MIFQIYLFNSKTLHLSTRYVYVQQLYTHHKQSCVRTTLIHNVLLCCVNAWRNLGGIIINMRWYDNPDVEINKFYVLMDWKYNWYWMMMTIYYIVIHQMNSLTIYLYSRNTMFLLHSLTSTTQLSHYKFLFGVVTFAI